MFSCCRASSKNSNLPKKVYNKKFEALTQNRNGKGETADDQKRIIPTIKIEKGKTNNFNDENNSFSPNVKESENVLENYPAINTMCDDIAIDGATKSETTDIAANTQLGNENGIFFIIIIIWLIHLKHSNYKLFGICGTISKCQ